MRHFILIPLALAGLSAFPPGQQPPATLAQKAVQKPAEPAAGAKPQGLTVDSVVSMVQAGLSEDVIIARIRDESGHSWCTGQHPNW